MQLYADTVHVRCIGEQNALEADVHITRPSSTPHPHNPQTVSTAYDASAETVRPIRPGAVSRSQYMAVNAKVRVRAGAGTDNMDKRASRRLVVSEVVTTLCDCTNTACVD